MRSTSSIEWELARTDKYKHFYEIIEVNELDKLHKELLNILIDFDLFCHKHNIAYYIMAGSLIGAVRHQGFIPWDDDIDIVVSRDDYSKLANLIKNDEISLKYSFKVPGEDNDISLCAKFMSKKISLGKLLNKELDEGNLYIDVLPIDFVPDNNLMRFFIGHAVNLLSFSYASLRCDKKYSPHLYKMAETSSEMRNNLRFRYLASIPARIIGAKNTIKLINKFLKIAKTDSKNITIALGVKRFFGEILDKNDIFPAKEIIFEGRRVLGPNNPDKYLSNRYGNYMQLPNDKEQVERLIRLKKNWEERG